MVISPFRFRANSTLKITYIGYKPVTVKSATIVNVLLEEDTQMVDEVVVTGYTTQRKADLTGAVSVVKVDEIQKQGENNPVKALQGRVPGMNITADGNPSGSATVRIRGIGTLNNNDPLYIIDGVPTKAGMHELNGNDIESIQSTERCCFGIYLWFACCKWRYHHYYQTRKERSD